MVVNLDLIPLFFLFFLYSIVEILITRTMEDYRLIQIEEEFEDEEEDYEGEYEEELIPEGIVFPRDINLIINEEDEEDYDDDDDDEEDYEEGEEGEELIPLATMLPGGSIDDEDYEDGDEDDEYYEEEEVEGLIPMEMISPRVSSSISHGRTLLGEVAINNGLVDNSELFVGNLGNQENDGGDGGNLEFNRGEIDGLFCPICFEAWTSGGDHQICCLPCGHIYGSSCIKKWLQQRRSSGKCPQCNNLCTLKDVRVLYATRLCVADEELQKRVRSLEARCSYLEQKDKYKEDDGWRGKFETYLEEFKAHRKEFVELRQEVEAFRQEVEAQLVALRQEVEAQLVAFRQEHEAVQQEFVAH
ncbi:E3 ubiquitin ligase BIG BROTHER-related [Cynara cardunculus var. scolymus]|uniref:Zinc finger, RING/FYVE/PHD-type n=1 Tax=Cynara cardunculus var. scolymus TaxID=59895 RepID=A0A118JTK2_CYNCS|nr:E3 ubiquitin ligase BIG BROTHER-related [Cynara cardunculus var. scolymus]KVH90417.1 Zinc finger, RING/FYVE/PHD-type [Cynara cardunculus var. scolymus]